MLLLQLWRLLLLRLRLLMLLLLLLLIMLLLLLPLSQQSLHLRPLLHRRLQLHHGSSTLVFRRKDLLSHAESCKITLECRKATQCSIRQPPQGWSRAEGSTSQGRESCGD